MLSRFFAVFLTVMLGLGFTQVGFAAEKTSKTQTAALSAKKQTASTKKKATLRSTKMAATSKRASAAVESQPMDPMPAALVAASPMPDPVEINSADIQTGELSCEMGAKVILRTADGLAGAFDLVHNQVHYRMVPVQSASGATRLEDPFKSAVWIQLPNKSMLLSQKLGRRLADECQTAEQIQVARAMRVNPPRGLLEPQTVVTASSVTPH